MGGPFHVMSAGCGGYVHHDIQPPDGRVPGSDVTRTGESLRVRSCRHQLRCGYPARRWRAGE